MARPKVHTQWTVLPHRSIERLSERLWRVEGALADMPLQRVMTIARWFLVKDRPALRSHLERLASMPDLRRIVVSHHEVIDRDPARVLRDVAATL